MIRIADNEPKYWEFIRTLRLMPECAKGFIEQGNITPEQQTKYMQEWGNAFKICLVDDEPVGYLRVIDNDISIAVHPKHQNKGIGLRMIRYIMRREPNAYAKIKVKNKVSIKLFEKAGYKLKYLHYDNLVE